MSIRNLNQGTPATDSQFPFGDTPNGVDRRCSGADLRKMILGDNADAEGWVTQYAAPNATGFTVAIAPPVQGQDTWLLLTPQAGYAAGAIQLPPKTAVVNRQEVEVLCSQSVAALTVTSTGVNVNGAPTALSANETFKLRYDVITNTWYPAT